MSGIILPGKDRKPQTGATGSAAGGGLELPKGFSRRREEEAAPVPAEPAPVVDETVAAEPPPAPAQPGRGPEMLFPPSGAQVQCPQCGTPFAVPVFTIIDLGANPELRNALLGGQINMAQCPKCGAGGQLSAPLMVHDPENNFLGVFTPMAGMDDIQRQKAIGDLTQALMRKLPQEARRGYMLQPMQYTDWTRFMEKQWEFQGVTPEMIRRQRQQTEALQSMIRIADDNSALDMVLERYHSLVDADFFALLDRLLMVASQQQDRASLERVVQLRNRLKETTEVGRKIQIAEDKVRALIDSITQETTPAEIIAKLTVAAGEPDGEQIAASVMMAISPVIDYQFLLAVSEKLEASSDEAERKALELLRTTATRIQEQVQASRQSMGAQLQELLQAVLQSEDPQATLNEYGDLIDENFLGLLAGNIDRAEKSGATGAARRFRQLYEMALNVVQQGMPPEVQLLNDLVNAPDQATMRRLLDENRSAINREFIESLRQLEDDFRQRGNPELADRIKSVRAAATLMQ